MKNDVGLIPADFVTIYDRLYLDQFFTGLRPRPLPCV